MTLRIKNWERFQHYKGRTPPWIKLYRGLLDDPEWFALSGDASKMLANCWLLASELNGQLPPITTIAFRLRMSEKKASELISQLNHWLEDDASATLADCKQNACLETERDTEEDTERDSDKKVVALRAPAPAKEKIVSRGTTLADDWKPTDDDFRFATDQGLRLVEIEIEATKFRNYWTAKSGKDAVKRNWPRTWENWILKATENRGYRNGKTNLLDEGRELAERAREFEREAGIGRSSDPLGSH